MGTDARGTLLDIVKGGAATAALFSAYLHLPIIGMAAGVVLPLPALYYDLKGGKAAGAAVVALAVVLAAVVEGPAAAFFYLMQAGILSLALPRFLARGQDPGRAIAFAVLIAGSAVAAAAVFFGLVQGIDIHAQVGAAIKSSIAQTLAFYEKSGIKGEELQLFREGMEQAGEMLARLYPALLLIGEAVVAGLNFLILQRLSVRLPVALPAASFSRFRAPDYLVWGLIAAGFALLVESGAVVTVALNVLIVVGFVYFLQGMAIVIHIFNAYAVPAFLRYLFYVLLIVQAYLAVAVALMGLFDLWADFRRPRPRKNL
jgi:uncharacterized protein YybS (DUF2232 family)